MVTELLLSSYQLKAVSSDLSTSKCFPHRMDREILWASLNVSLSLRWVYVRLWQPWGMAVNQDGEELLYKVNYSESGFDAVWSRLCLFSVNKKLTKTVLWSVWANSVTNTSEDKYQANQITLTDNANTCKCSTCIKLPMCYRGKKHNTLFFTKLISAQNLIMIKDSCTGYSDDHIWCLLVNVRWL